MSPAPIYPLRYVRPHPGSRPSMWRVLARRRWTRAIRERNAAKRWNFGALYGRRMVEVTAAALPGLVPETAWATWTIRSRSAGSRTAGMR